MTHKFDRPTPNETCIVSDLIESQIRVDRWAKEVLHVYRDLQDERQGQDVGQEFQMFFGRDW